MKRLVTLLDDDGSLGNRHVIGSTLRSCKGRLPLTPRMRWHPTEILPSARRGGISYGVYACAPAHGPSRCVHPSTSRNAAASSSRGCQAIRLQICKSELARCRRGRHQGLSSLTASRLQATTDQSTSKCQKWRSCRDRLQRYLKRQTGRNRTTCRSMCTFSSRSIACMHQLSPCVGTIMHGSSQTYSDRCGR